MRRKVRLRLVVDQSKRKAAFMKRKRGLLKKLQELTTLCGVQACGVIYSPYQPEPEVWPSKEGVEEVFSRFLAMPEDERTKCMMTQETYLQARISRVNARAANLASENQDFQVRQFMFDCLEGKMSEHHYGAEELRDLLAYIDLYIAKINRRIQMLGENGESSSSIPPPTLPVGIYSGTVSAASGLFDHIQHQNTNMKQTQQETQIQHHLPIDSSDTTQSQNMDMNQSQQGMNFDSNQNLNVNPDMNSNQYLSLQQSFMGMMLEEDMDDAGGHASTPFMDGNLPVTTSLMPSNTNNTNNNL